MITSVFGNKCMTNTQNYMYLGCTPCRVRNFTYSKKGLLSSCGKIITGQTGDVVWIEPLLQCTIKCRGYLGGGKLMTPVFVNFIHGGLIVV